MGSTSTLERTEIDPQTGEAKSAHIIAPKGKGDDYKDGAVLAMEGRLNGTPVKALCGHVFVPSRDPESLPTCQKCLDILEHRTGSRDGWQNA
jgi:hypothetical protein